MNSEQALAERAVVAERCGLSGPGDPAAIDDGGMVGDRQRDLGVLLNHQRGNSPVPQLPDRRQHVTDDFRRQALARLVEQIVSTPARGRAIATICISPPDRFSHSRSIKYSSGEKISQASLIVQLRNRVRFCAMPRLRATESVRTQPPVIRAPSHPPPARDFMRRAMRYLTAIESDRAAARTGQAENRT